MTQDSYDLNRRRFLVGSAASAIVAVGCRQDSAPLVQATEERRDVPLRLAMVGTDQDAESIRRGWGAVTDQPIDIQPIELDRADAGSLAELVVLAAKKSDLVIYPFAWVAQASFAEVVVGLSDDEVEQIDQATGNLLAALRSGTRYAGEYLAVPLGAPLPAMLSIEPIADPTKLATWEDYDELVASQWGGLAGEPTAPGWAGAMFLWRTAAEKSWLFNRENLEPVVDTEPYVQSLDLMVRTSAKYETKLQTPDQVWTGVKSGKLKGGIGFPQIRTQADGEFHLGNMPGVNELSKVLLDPYSRVISLSANCRQSAASKRFIQWISGGEGSATVRQQVTGMTEIRGKNPSGQANSTSGAGSYDQWLTTRLSSPVTMPTLQLLQAGDYYAALDHHVGRALAGDTTPKEAMAAVAQHWQETTKEVGVEKQLRAWRRAQGMRV